MKQLKMDGTTVKARREVFKDHHREQFGLKISERHPVSKEVKSVLCRFCVAFGREDAPSEAKTRKKTTNVKYYTKSFRVELFRKHLVGQHPLRWADYSRLATEEERQGFFVQTPVPFVETLHAVFETEKELLFSINSGIVDTIIGKLLFHPDDVGTRSHTRAMAVFKRDGESDSTYVCTEKNPSRFRLCVRFLGRGASFRMAAALMDDAKEETGIGRFGGCSEDVVARYARLVCAASLQRLSQCLDKVWTFSLATDCATHQGKSYADVRCRFYLNGELHNFHLLAIPLYERHTAINIFNVVETFLDTIVPSWRTKVLGVATDGAATMVGNVGGLVTLMEAQVQYPIVRVWCGLHQLDLKMQIIFQSALNDSYLGTLTALIGYLRRQQNLISDMKSKCPKVASTRWLSMFKVADWLCRHGFEVRTYVEDRGMEGKPNLVWWIFLHALREVAREANAVFVSLQGLTTLVQQQEGRFEGLAARLMEMSGVVGPLSDEAIAALPIGDHQVIGHFAISHVNALAYIMQLDLWVIESLESLNDEQKHVVVCAIARMYVLAVFSIYSLSSSESVSPPVTPKDLAAASLSSLADTIGTHRPRLIEHFGEAGIYRIGQEFKELQRAVKCDESVSKAIASFDHRLAGFGDMWRLGAAASRYPTLIEYCGGMASVFANTATVEADFSVVGCEKNDKRTSMTDVSLEGILHCKQWKSLSRLSA